MLQPHGMAKLVQQQICLAAQVQTIVIKHVVIIFGDFAAGVILRGIAAIAGSAAGNVDLGHIHHRVGCSCILDKRNVQEGLDVVHCSPESGFFGSGKTGPARIARAAGEIGGFRGAGKLKGHNLTGLCRCVHGFANQSAKKHTFDDCCLGCHVFAPVLLVLPRGVIRR